MLKKLYLFFLFVGVSISLHAQKDTTHLRFSLLTVGVGDEIYTAFGHTGIRITDSENHSDEVYNYGTFDVRQPNFELMFARGKLLYYLSIESFAQFMYGNQIDGRPVVEQVLNLSAPQKLYMLGFLQWNAKPQNSAYKYDFIYDNCATRVRNLFPKTLGDNYQFSEARANFPHYTFRQIINYYLQSRHLERLGINILLGSPVDKEMGNTQSMFLPSFLASGIANSTSNGITIAAKPLEILPGKTATIAGPNWGFVITISILLLMLISYYPPLKLLNNILSKLIFIITGLLGCLILFMWLGTDHQTCRPNFNILWALPTNLLLAFSKPKGRGRYAIIAIGCILISLVLHIVKIQELPLQELVPLFCAEVLAFGMVYRLSVLKPAL